MPIYEYRCGTCAAITTRMLATTRYPATVECAVCARRARRIISGAAVVRSNASKVERLDPRYDRLVDRAMAANPTADPDRLLRRMRDPAARMNSNSPKKTPGNRDPVKKARPRRP